MISKKILLALVIAFLNVPLFASSDDFIYVLNPDPYSQSIGASILSLSPSVFGFFTNPASNYTNISKEVQLSYYTIYNNNYGINAGLLWPTEKIGNFSFIVSAVDLNEKEIGYKQGRAVQKLFEKEDYTVNVYKDYSGKDRIVVAVPKYYE